MSKRKYTKRSDYWNKFNQEPKADLGSLIDNSFIGPSSSGEPYYSESIASSYSRSQSGSEEFASRRNYAHKSDKKHRFSNIASGMLPYVYNSEGVNLRETI